MSEVAYGTEALEDGVYSLTTTTRYNAAAQPLTSVQKQLISQLSALIESKSVFVSERGLTSVQWTEYSEHTKRVQYSTVPTSSITAEVVTVDGSALSQKDTAGVVTTFTRSYTVNGIWDSHARAINETINAQKKCIKQMMRNCSLRTIL